MVGQFFTPEIVVQCAFGLAGARPGQRVIDPSCGDGSFLRAAPLGLDLQACEIDPRYAEIARGLVGRRAMIQDNALTALERAWGTFDLAVGNPPFSAQTSLEKRAEVLARYDLGAGRRSQCLEVLFVELFWRLLKPDGRLAIVLPDGPLSNRPFQFVRDWLLCRAHVEAIISLPRGIFAGTDAKTSLLVARRRPVSTEPYREPTALLECRSLDELKLLPLAEWKQVEPRWVDVVLADAKDWRPEAVAGSGEDDASSVRLGDLFTMRTGKALYGAQRELHDEPGDDRLVLIRAKNLDPDGGFRLDQNRAYISRQSGMYNEKALVQPGELLFVRVGAGCYGRTALVPDGLEAQADDWIHILTPRTEVDAAGLVAWFSSPTGRTAVKRLTKGVGTVSISKSSLAELRVPTKFQNAEPELVATA